MVDLTGTTRQDTEQLLLTHADYHVESGGSIDDSIVDLYCRTPLGRKRIIEVEGFRSNFFIHHDEFLAERETLLKERRILAIECVIQPGEWDHYLDDEALASIETVDEYREAVEQRFADSTVTVHHEDVRDALDSDAVRDQFADDDLEEMSHTDVVKLYVEQPGHVGGDDGLRSHFQKTWEADVPFPSRFLIDSDIYRGIEAPVDTDRVRYENWPGASGSNTQINEIEPCDPPVVSDDAALEWDGLRTRLNDHCETPSEATEEDRPDMPARTLTLDIEVLTEGEGFPEAEHATQPVTAITAHDNYSDDYVTWVLDDGWDFDGDAEDYVDEDAGITDPRVGVFTDDVQTELGLDVDIRMFGSETTMLDNFNEWVNQHSFDIFTGWNSNGFDYPYLINRAYNVGAYRVSEWGHGGKPYAITGRDDRDDEPRIPGVVCLDLLTAYQKTIYTALDSKKLENVADHVLGFGKAEPPGEDLDEAYHQHPVEFVRYSVRDTQATVGIDRTRGVRDLFDNLRAVTGALYPQCEANWQMLDVLFLRKAKEVGITLPTSVEPDEKCYHGAKVFEPAPGTHDNVIYPDLASLYPNSLWTLNTSPDVLYDTLEDARRAGYSEDDLARAPVDRRDWKVVPEGVEFDEDAIDKEQYKGVKDETGSQRAIFDPVRDDVYFVKPDVEEGFVRSLVDELIGLKNEYRGTDMYESVKRVTNSLYGVLSDSNTGGTGFRLCDWRIGESITLFGRTIITETAEQIESYIQEHYDEDAQVIGGDTDSAMLSIPNAPDFETALEWAHEAVDYLEGTGEHDDGPGHYDEVIEERFNLDVCDPDSPDEHRMAVDIESLASKLFFQANPDEVFDDPDEATKKRYAEHIVWDEDDGWLDIDGDYYDAPDQDEETELADRDSISLEDYADGLLDDQEPEDNVSVTGFDYVRSDTAEITDEAQMELFVSILLADDTKDRIYEYVSQRYEEIRSGDIELEVIAKKAGINNPLEDYGYDDDEEAYVRKAGPTYRGAKYATDHIPWEEINPGTKPYRVYVDDVSVGGDLDLPEVYEYDTFRDAPEVGDEVDAVTIMETDRFPDAITPAYDKMMEKEFRDRIEPILLTIDMTWDEIVGEGRQERFGDGFADISQTKYEGVDEEDDTDDTTQTQQTGLDAF